MGKTPDLKDLEHGVAVMLVVASQKQPPFWDSHTLQCQEFAEDGVRNQNIQLGADLCTMASVNAQHIYH